MAVRYLGTNWAMYKLNKRYSSDDSGLTNKQVICKKKICPVILLLLVKKR